MEIINLGLKFVVGLFFISIFYQPNAIAQRGEFDVKILQSIEKYETAILEARHKIHANPELGNEEFETAALVAAHLKKHDIEVKTGVAHTGVIGILRGGRPGPIVAVRADMDALPVTEATDLPFKSTKTVIYNGQEVGVMHACGHDIHTSVLMGVASILSDLKNDLPGTVMFIFQPAEEGPPPGEEGGAKLMLKEGIFNELKPSAIFGLHSDTEITVGKLGYTVGAVAAASDYFQISIIGSQTHVAFPHQGVDPIVMASQTVLALQTIHSRNIDPLKPSVISIGMIHGGERSNIIPERVTLEGTVRTYDAEVRDAIERRMKEILKGITSAGGGTYEFNYDRGYPATINDPQLTQLMIPTLETVLGKTNVEEVPPLMVSEDFSYYAQEVPGFFFFLSIQKDGIESGPNHSPTFRADDSAVAVGMRTMSNLVVDFMKLHSDVK